MSLFNKLIVSTLPIIPKKVVGYFAARYIAGEFLEDGIRVVKEMNARGIKTTMDVLGEGVNSKEESLEMRKQCEDVLHAIHQHRLDSTLSVKPTQMGLTFDKEFCLENIRHLCKIAGSYNTSVCIDMEDHPYTDSTLEIYDRLRNELPSVSCVLQSYMRRSESDVASLLPRPTNLRLCKGIYVEPEAIAFKTKEEVRANYKKLLRQLLNGKAFVGIATHDDELIHDAYELIRENKLTPHEYEFQMLLGVREYMRDKIHADGHPLRVYIPFGKQWYAYSTRRLKENPQMAGYIVKSIFRLDGKK